MPTPETTPDIFISYAHEDRDVVVRMAGAFETQGWRVWWDRQIRVGSQFDEIIADNLRSARVVIVLWSQHSVRSGFVKDESSRARDAGRLHPVRIDESELPLGFGQIQTMLVPNGDVDSQQFADLIEHLGAALEQADSSRINEGVMPPPLRGKSRQSRLMQPRVWLLPLVVALVGASGYTWWRSERCGEAVNLVVQGKDAIDNQQIDQAMVRLDRAVEICSSAPKAWLYRGLARVSTRDPELMPLAEQDIRHALMLKLDKQYQQVAHQYLDMLEQVKQGRSAVAVLAEQPSPKGEPMPEARPPDAPKPEPAAGPAPPSKQPATPDPGAATEPRPSTTSVRTPRVAQQSAVAQIFDDSKDTRIAATTALVLDQKTLPEIVPQIIDEASRRGDNKSGVINSLVLLQNAGPKALRAERERIEPLLQHAERSGPQSAEQVARVRAAMRPIVYIQIGDEAQRLFATRLQRDLTEQGFEVPDIENVKDPNKLPASPEVRLRDGSSRGGGLIVALQIESLGAPKPIAKTIKQARVERDTYEVWLSRAMCMERGQPPAACGR